MPFIQNQFFSTLSSSKTKYRLMSMYLKNNFDIVSEKCLIKLYKVVGLTLFIYAYVS